MSGRKTFRPDRVEQFAREHEQASGDGPSMERDESARARALLTLSPRDPAQERAERREAAKTVTDRALSGKWELPEIRNVLDKLGLLPGPSEPARKPRRSAGSKAGGKRVAECGRLIAEEGLTVEQVALRMGIETDTVREYYRLYVKETGK